MSDKNDRGAISTSPDEFAGRRRGATPGPRRRAGGGEGGGGSRLVGNLGLAVLAAGLLVAGWFIAEQYQQLQESDRSLADARARIEVMEDRLRTTDEALTETGANTSEQINFWESEIRKLWAVTNDRNKKWIEDNQKAIAALQQSLSGLEATDRDI
ncbi:MAG: hypothetical protein RIE74_00960, partial [Pseudomonadales bacterium]